MATADPLLTVEDLRVRFRPGRKTVVDAVRGVGFTLGAGECLAIVGESGSGKSATARSLVGLAGATASVDAARMELGGDDLTSLSDRQWRGVRGRRIGLVLQDALSALDPLRTVGAEITEALANHAIGDRADRPAKVVDLLGQVRVPDPELRARQRPHQLSGGLRQRALLASAMAADPQVLIADEPTTALDVTVAAQILTLLEERKRQGTAILLISHDLAVVARLADRIAVMYRGAFVEEGETARILTSPEHPYTRELLAAVPSAHAKGTRLSPRSTPLQVSEADRAAAGARDAGEVLIEAEGIGKSFRGPDHVLRPAVADVSLSLGAGEALGIVGESGSGKTTTAMMVLGLEEPDAGEVRLFGRPWSHRPEAERRGLRRRIQLIQQDPLASFDPRHTVERIVGAGLGEPGRRGARRRLDRIVELLELVGLDAATLVRRPHQLSGGQRQRVGIARALAPRPDVIVCDEPVSALDVSIQAQILDLLADVRAELSVALLFISHDLAVVHHACDRVMVMQEGGVVETGDVEEVFSDPAHPYTKTLLTALPGLDFRDTEALHTPSD